MTAIGGRARIRAYRVFAVTRADTERVSNDGHSTRCKHCGTPIMKFHAGRDGCWFHVAFEQGRAWRHCWPGRSTCTAEPDE